MKALQRFVQLSLIMVITLTTMGFRVNLEECHGHQDRQLTFFGSPDCCCDKDGKASKPQKSTCGEVTCVVQTNYQSGTNYNLASETTAKKLKTTPTYTAFTHNIRPVLQEKIPHFTLPPPRTGRFVGILHQTFII